MCDQVADSRRVGEWNDAAKVWFEQHSASVTLGVCPIYRAELKWLESPAASLGLRGSAYPAICVAPSAALQVAHMCQYGRVRVSAARVS